MLHHNRYSRYQGQRHRSHGIRSLLHPSRRTLSALQGLLLVMVLHRKAIGEPVGKGVGEGVGAFVGGGVGGTGEPVGKEVGDGVGALVGGKIGGTGLFVGCVVIHRTKYGDICFCEY